MHQTLNPKATSCFGYLSLHPPQRLPAQTRQLCCSLPKQQLPISPNLRRSHYTKDSSCPFGSFQLCRQGAPTPPSTKKFLHQKSLPQHPGSLPPITHCHFPPYPQIPVVFTLSTPKQYLFAPEQQRPPLCS